MTKEEREEQRAILAQLKRDAYVLSQYFQLRLRAVEAERAGVKSRYGICYDDGTIRIRLRHATHGRLLKYSALVDTLCHELAHLRYFNHGDRFQRFYRRILEHARYVGIYRPEPRRRRPPQAPVPLTRAPATLRPRTPPAPEQLDLF